MDRKDNSESKGGGAATASKAAASKKQVGNEAPSPGQGATGSKKGAGVTPFRYRGRYYVQVGSLEDGGLGAEV